MKIEQRNKAKLILFSNLVFVFSNSSSFSDNKKKDKNYFYYNIY